MSTSNPVFLLAVFLVGYNALLVALFLMLALMMVASRPFVSRRPRPRSGCSSPWGEGPCSEALAQGRPVRSDEATMLQRWPVLAALHGEATPFRGGLSVPLRTGDTRFGALDLYLRDHPSGPGHDVIAVQFIAHAIADVLMSTLEADTPPSDVASSAVEGDGHGPSRGADASWLNNASVRRRREVWVAVAWPTSRWLCPPLMRWLRFVLTR